MWEDSTKIPSTRATVIHDLFNTRSCVWCIHNQTIKSIKSSAPVHKHWCLAHESPMLVCTMIPSPTPVRKSSTPTLVTKPVARTPKRCSDAYTMIVQFAARTKASSTAQHQSTNTGAILRARSATHARNFRLPQWLILANDSTRQQYSCRHISQLSSNFEMYMQELKPPIMQQTPVYHEMTFFLASNKPQTILDF